MRRIRYWPLFLFGAGAILLGLALIPAQMVTFAQDEASPAERFEDAEYVGVRDCSTCHSDLARVHRNTPHALAFQEEDDDVILGDFEQGEEVRQVVFEEGDDPRAFTERDLEYVVGIGRDAQAYVTEMDDDVLMVLPAIWNVRTQSWEPYTLAESWPAPEYEWGPNCAGCHTTGLVIDDGEYEWEDDGVQCEACHGPGSEHTDIADDAGNNPDDEELIEIRASIYRGPDPQVCGRCHSQGVEPESNHPYPLAYLPGMELLDENIFTLVPQDAPEHWWASGHASDKYMQFNEWVISSHASSLEAVLQSEFADESCLSCHSGDYASNQQRLAEYESGEREGLPPEAVTLETAQFGVLCSSCHTSHPGEPEEADEDEAGDEDDEAPAGDDEAGDDAAAPEKTASLTAETYPLCTSCHQNPDDFIHHPAQEMFEGITIVEQVEGIPDQHFVESEGPKCVTCHMLNMPVDGDNAITESDTGFGSRASHTFDPIFPGEAEGGELPFDSCTTCHEDANRITMQQLINDVQTRTQARLEALNGQLGDDSAEWVRDVVAFVEGDASYGIHNHVYTDALLTAAEVELGIVPAVAPTPDPRALVNVPLPESEIAQAAADPDVEAGTGIEAQEAEGTEFVAGDVESSLTLPSIIMLAIMAGVVLIAGYAFFFRRSR